MSSNYRSTEKEKVRPEAGWKKKKKAAMWRRYQDGKITRQQYDQACREIDATTDPYPRKESR
jgi:hypothetical protein